MHVPLNSPPPLHNLGLATVSTINISFHTIQYNLQGSNVLHRQLIVKLSHFSPLISKLHGSNRKRL